MKIHDENHAIGKPFAHINVYRKSNGEEYWRYGEYHFEHGTINIYHEPKLVSLSYYTGGRGYYRTIRGKTYTDIGLARVAGIFARQLFVI